MVSLKDHLKNLNLIKQGRVYTKMTFLQKLLAALAGTSATLAESSKGTTSLIAGLFAVFLGLFTNPSAPSAQAHAETAKIALKANKI